jgi:hypothetical protein
VGNKNAVTAALLAVSAGATWAYIAMQRPAPRPLPVSSAAASAPAPPPSPEPPVPQGPATYVFPPQVHGGGLPNGQYQTELRITKTAGPWPSEQESKFEVWFDGDVQKEFMSRGFADPVDFDVKTPEPRHLSIRIKSPPIEVVTYVAFTFKSAKPVQILKTEVSPKSEEPAKADR